MTKTVNCGIFAAYIKRTERTEAYAAAVAQSYSLTVLQSYRERSKMENKKLLVISLCFFLYAMMICDGIEMPQFTVVHSESDFEIRLYRESAWMSAEVQEISFEKATRGGFHRLFQYIEGANLNNSRVSMTFPVLTSIAREAGPLHSSAYVVQFYLPVKFQDSPPLPLPELKLEPHVWTSHCIAVRKFSGFARDGNVIAEAKKLALSLSRSPWAYSTSSDGKYAYSIAQYNSPFRLIGRVNEVWVDIDGSETEGCASGGDVATY